MQLENSYREGVESLSKYQKIYDRLMSKPKDFDYSEAKKILEHFGFCEYNAGKTSGSRVAFVDSKGRIYRMHKPHPDGTLKDYMVNDLIQFIKELEGE